MDLTGVEYNANGELLGVRFVPADPEHVMISQNNDPEWPSRLGGDSLLLKDVTDETDLTAFAAGDPAVVDKYLPRDPDHSNVHTTARKLAALGTYAVVTRKNINFLVGYGNSIVEGPEPINLDNGEKDAVRAELAAIAQERKELAGKDPREFVFGFTPNKELVVVDEFHGVMTGDERFVVRVTPISSLVEGESSQEQRMSYGDVTRFRDGGTTIMPTQFGELIVSAPHRKMRPTLDGVVLSPVTEVMSLKG